MQKPIAPSSPPSQAPSEPTAGSDQSLAPQLGRLYGETLFGAWQDPLASIEASRRSRKRGRWAMRMGIVLLLASVTAAGTWLYGRGLARRTEQDRAQIAKDVGTFLHDGELDRLAQYVAILQPPTEPLDAEAPYLDLIVSSEAALFRYQDAAPERVARIAAHIASDSATPARILARLTLLSEPERAQAWDRLASQGPSLDKNPEYHTVLATVLEQRGDLKAARAAWERSAQAGPLWLPHRYLQCAFEARQGNAQAVARVAEQMAKVAPESAWTRMALRHFAKTTPAPAGMSAPQQPSAVGRYHDELAQVLPNLASRNLAAARPALGRALAAVQGQPPFVLDAFAMLAAAKANDLAMEMTSYEVWPRDNSWGRTKALEIAAAPATAPAAATTTAMTAGAETTKETKSKKAKASKKEKKKKAGKTKRRGGRRR